MVVAPRLDGSSLPVVLAAPEHVFQLQVANNEIDIPNCLPAEIANWKTYSIVSWRIAVLTGWLCC